MRTVFASIGARLRRWGWSIALWRFGYPPSEGARRKVRELLAQRCALQRRLDIVSRCLYDAKCTLAMLEAAEEEHKEEDNESNYKFSV